MPFRQGVPAIFLEIMSLLWQVIERKILAWESLLYFDLEKKEQSKKYKEYLNYEKIVEENERNFTK